MDTRRYCTIQMTHDDWNRILDLMIIGSRIVNRFVDTDPDEAEQDARVCARLENELVKRGAISDEPTTASPTVINVTKQPQLAAP